MAEKHGKNLITRPPVVVIIGHVDHGKTTLLDYIRKTNVAAREAGGITQSIGAYEIVHNNKRITFVDTPGHEAFSKMRARGANVADLAILVVAADDGLQPQTKESIEILKQTKTPFIVAINKIDKPNADVEKTKNDLMQAEVFLEGYGGNVSWHKISAKMGEGVNELLDLVLLAAEMEGLTYDPVINASGVVIEAKMDSRRGVTAIGIVKNGILKIGDGIATPTVCGKAKLLENFLGERVEKLEPSSPVLILGFDNLPQIGEEFIAVEVDPSIERAEIIYRPKEELIKTEEGKPALNLVLKADVSGSLEALSEIIRNLNQGNVRINIMEESVGEITDGDVKRSAPHGAIIIGFNAKSTKAADNLAKALEVKVLTSKIIYELVQAIEREMKNIENPPPLAEVEILALFSQKDKKQLIGGKVLSGALKNNIQVKIFREATEIGSGKITSLKSHKQEINQVLPPSECGIMIESPTAIAAGDKLMYQK